MRYCQCLGLDIIELMILSYTLHLLFLSIYDAELGRIFKISKYLRLSDRKIYTLLLAFLIYSNITELVIQLDTLQLLF